VLLANVIATALAAPAWCQTPDAGAKMKKPMMDPTMMDEGMMMARQEMMGMMADDTIVPAIAREITIQAMMADDSMMMAMDQKMMKDDPQAKQMMANKVAAAKAALMKDKKAMMAIVQEVMLRRMVAMAIEMEMMHEPAAAK